MRLSLFTTTFINQERQELEKTYNFKKDNGIENHAINLYPDMKYQTIEGFGGALTDAAGYVYSQMDENHKKQVIDTYFKKEGLNYQLVRIPIDSCDFSVDMYEAMSDQEDQDLSSFNIARTAKYIIPLLSDAVKAAGKPLDIIISPWSPPAFMKTNGERCHGGKLKREYQSAWAEYICRYILELRKSGFSVKGLTLQNEPNATQTWDSCTYNGAEEKEFLRDHMYPALVRNHLSEVEIFIWDHNKERIFERACEVIDEVTNKMVAGVAFHWYSGDHFEAVGLVREKFPDKKLIMSEACVEYNKFGNKGTLSNAQKYAHEIIGNLNHGMNGFYDWNILLDSKGGPNHVGNFCDAPILYDISEHQVMERHSLSYIRHFSHYIQQGAARIAYTKYSDNLDVTACMNPDGKVIVVILNRTEDRMPAVIRMMGDYTEFDLEPQSITTGVIE